jgi:hypothetical protein
MIDELLLPSTDQEGSLQHRAVRRTRSPVYEEDTTTPESDAGSGTVSESSTSQSTRPSLNTHQSSPGSHIISPVLSLCRARARALTIAGTSEVSRTERGKIQGTYGDGCSNGDGYESRFSRRVKEKLREVHVHDYESPREPSNQVVEPRASAEDAERNGKQKYWVRHNGGLQMTDQMPVPLSHSHGPSNIEDPASPARSNLSPTKPLHVRTAKPRLLGPRKPNVASAPGSVMERVRMIEGRGLQAKS